MPSGEDGYLCSGMRPRPMSGSGFLLAIPAIVGAFRDRGGGLYAARRRMRSTGDKGRRGGSSDPSDIICLRAQSSKSTPRSSGPRMLPCHLASKQPSAPFLSPLSMLCIYQRDFLGKGQDSSRYIDTDSRYARYQTCWGVQRIGC